MGSYGKRGTVALSVTKQVQLDIPDPFLHLDSDQVRHEEILDISIETHRKRIQKIDAENQKLEALRKK